jgi:hypothetical protein
MYQRYQSKTVTDKELDRMIAEAEADAEEDRLSPRFVVAEDVDVSDDDAIDDRIVYVLDRLAHSDEDDRWRRDHGLPTRGSGIDGQDVLRAARECSLVLGTVFDSAHRFDKVVALDYDGCTDGAAWATVAALPDWVVYRYRKLASAAEQR